MSRLDLPAPARDHVLDMNYYSHGVRFLDRPWFAAGTAIPDWLSVADRKVRMRVRDVTPFADGSGSFQAEVAAGVLQHLADDDWFHSSQAFLEVTSQLTRLFRELLPDDDSPRCSFLGHIVTELLLDSVLIERNPPRLERYYEVFQQLKGLEIQQAVNAMARKSTDQLAWFVDMFPHERFLSDYGDDARLCHRLNQVLRRVKLEPLPPAADAVLGSARLIVRARTDELLPGFEAALHDMPRPAVPGDVSQ